MSLSILAWLSERRSASVVLPRCLDLPDWTPLVGIALYENGSLEGSGRNDASLTCYVRAGTRVPGRVWERSCGHRTI